MWFSLKWTATWTECRIFLSLTYVYLKLVFSQQKVVVIVTAESDCLWKITVIPVTSYWKLFWCIAIHPAGLRYKKKHKKNRQKDQENMMEREKWTSKRDCLQSCLFMRNLTIFSHNINDGQITQILSNCEDVFEICFFFIVLLWVRTVNQMLILY